MIIFVSVYTYVTNSLTAFVLSPFFVNLDIELFTTFATVKIMGRILAIDYGQKRCGLAVTDELVIIANALDTVPAKELIAYLTKYISQENVSLFVIGEPKQMNNQASDSSRFINPFIGRLRKAFPHIPIERMDERFTSRMAFQSMIDAGLGKKARQNKALIDSISATLILQSYLETKT